MAEGQISAVAPHAGAWIEIGHVMAIGHRFQSLPMRERGLKYVLLRLLQGLLLSLPMRERGLKYGNVLSRIPVHRSLPMRERGLKYLLADAGMLYHGRSPCGSVD